MRRLYELVEQYYELGIHRTGTDVDSLTAQWFAELLEQRGATISLAPYAFAFYDPSCTVRINERRVESMALYYSGFGQYRGELCATGVVSAHDEGETLERAIHAVKNRALACERRGAVLATDCPTQSLCAINRSSDVRDDFPVALVAGKHRSTLNSCRVELDFDARIRTRTSHNVVARFGKKTSSPLLITTPLTGWFGCAGERGTGIAVLLDIVAELSAKVPLVVVGATGHELDYLGARRYADSIDWTPRAVLHIGSSVATSASDDAQSTASLTRDLQLTNNLAGEGLEVVTALAQTLQMKLVSPAKPSAPDEWIGESTCWARFGCPMVSIAGLHPWFHTPQDSPFCSTNEALLQRVAGTVARISDVLCQPT